jgi:rubrerythrin
MKNFSDLTEAELLALAVMLEEEDNRTYLDLSEAMRDTYPGTAKMFAAMAEEENDHRHRLLDLYQEKFGDHIPMIRRQDVKGFLERKSVWLLRPLNLEKVRAQAELMEAEAKRFYQTAARRSNDVSIRQLLGTLQPKSVATRHARKSSNQLMCRAGWRSRKPKPSGASLSYRSCNPVLRALWTVLFQLWRPSLPQPSRPGTAGRHF